LVRSCLICYQPRVVKNFEMLLRALYHRSYVSFGSLVAHIPKQLQTTGQVSDDLVHNEILATLFKTSQTNRDHDWYSQFRESCANAAFKGDMKPQVIQGPDSWYYFRLALPDQMEKFTKYSFKTPEFMDYCLKVGVGVAIFENSKSAENPENAQHVFSFGDVISYHYFKSFEGDPIDLYEIQHQSVHPKIHPSMYNTIRPPNNHFLPLESQPFLKLFLESAFDNKNYIPKVAMGVDPKAGFPTRKLLLNLATEEFDNEEEASDFLNCVRWFLPKGRSVGLFKTKAQISENSDEYLTLQGPSPPQ